LSRRCGSVAVFCGSSSGRDPAFAAAARELGARLAAEGRTLVYGGGRVGLMGVLADAALAGGGRVIGVIPEALAAREVAHLGLSELRVVASMHVRKATMADLAEAFVALPGGFGTLDELFEIVTWAQLGLHAKPIALLEVSDYFAGLRELVERAVADGLVRPEHRSLFHVGGSVDAVLAHLDAGPPEPPLPKWA
jgi:uncharacterized protein (TIGR00730 family)